MKYDALSLGVIALAGGSSAFPTEVYNYVAESNLAPADFKPLEKRLNGISPGFDAKKQYISTTGKYKFVPPGPTDLRGPCPGLNSLANHGYLPHNGVATIEQYIDATTRVFGMGLDLAGFLSLYGAIFDGDLIGFSMAGPPPTSLVDPLAGLIGQPTGLSGSHNKYECDVSPTRGDLYMAGNDYDLVMKQFTRLYESQAHLSNEESNYDLGILQAYRVERFHESVTKNPYFFNGPFSGIQVQPAAFTFMYRFMGNKSHEYPEGRLTQEVLKSFFSVQGEYPNFNWVPGHERIPDNWYRRAFGDEYTIPFFEEDVLAEAISYPQFLDIGGNLGKPNTFTPLDITNLTGGIYNLKNLAEGHNAFCFSFELLTQAAPDILEGTLSNVGKALGMLNDAVAKATAGFGCPKLFNINKKQLQEAYDKYPGYSQLTKDGTYKQST